MKPSILLFILLPSLVIAVVFVILRFWQGQNQWSWQEWVKEWFDKASSEGGKTRREVFQQILTSTSAVATYFVICLGAIMELVAEQWYNAWIGGEKGWYVFFAALISIPMSAYLVKKGGALKIAGISILCIGFLGPILITTRPGQVMARTYGETMDYFQYGEKSKNLKLGAFETIKEPRERVPVWYLPEKCCFIFKKTMNDGKVINFAQGPDGFKQGSIIFNGREIEVIQDITGHPLYILEVAPTVDGPRKIRFVPN